MLLQSLCVALLCLAGASDAALSKTVIYFNVNTQPGQNVFIRGGISSSLKAGCTGNAGDPCSLAITYDGLGYSSPFTAFNAWRNLDSYLDWYGKELYQGMYQGALAQGSPLVWTTNNAASCSYMPDNSWGDNYWKWEVMMDCSTTLNGLGWFEFKGYMNNAWENDISQGTCTGSSGGTRPYSTSNHWAMCGRTSVFTWGQNSCQINYNQ